MNADVRFWDLPRHRQVEVLLQMVPRRAIRSTRVVFKPGHQAELSGVWQRSDTVGESMGEKTLSQ